jgi:hypothetical protein
MVSAKNTAARKKTGMSGELQREIAEECHTNLPRQQLLFLLRL